MLTTPENTPRPRRIHLDNLQDIGDLGAYNCNSGRESDIVTIVKDPSKQKEPLPEISPAELRSPLNWVHQNPGYHALIKSTPNPAIKGFQSPKQKQKTITKTTAKETAKKIVLAMGKTHAKKSVENPKNQYSIFWDFSGNGSKNCVPFFLKTPTSSGRFHDELTICPDCGTVRKYRSFCDNPRCSSKFCLDHYAETKGDDFAGRVSMISDMLRSPPKYFHIVVSFPPDLAGAWIQWGPHYEQMVRMVRDIITGLGFQGYASVTHTHRGTKKKDTDLKDSVRWLGLPIRKTMQEFAGEDMGYYWRVGPHVHNIAVSFMPREIGFYKAVCREIYNLTGIVVAMWEHNNPAQALKYMLTHAGVPSRIREDGTKGRALPTIRYYGVLSPRGPLQKVELGTTIAGRPCTCEKCKARPLTTLYHTPAVHPHKLTAYRPRARKGQPDPLGEQIAEVLDHLPTVGYWNNFQEPILQRVVTPQDLLKLRAIDDLFIPRENIPRYMFDNYPYCPDDLPALHVPLMVSEDYTGPDSSEDPEKPPEDPGELPEIPRSSLRRSPRDPGQLYDMYELMGFLADNHTDPAGEDIPKGRAPGGGGDPVGPAGAVRRGSASASTREGPEGPGQIVRAGSCTNAEDGII